LILQYRSAVYDAYKNTDPHLLDHRRS
jgi:hypothetical protein